MVAELARIEERIDRTVASGTSISTEIAGVHFQNMGEVMEFAKLMSVAGNAVPKHLQGNPGMCLAVCVQALEWRFSPFQVANKSYEVQGRLCFESQLVHALIEQRAPIVGRLRHKYEGEGDERVCVVSAKLRDTGETLEYKSPAFGKIQPKNSPLWKTKPDLQLYYNTSRDFCRAYFPDVLLGVYADDELREHVGPDNAKEVTGLKDRLKGGKGRGFSRDHVEQHASRGAVIDETPAPASDQSESSQPSHPSPSNAETTPAADAASSTVEAAGTSSHSQELPEDSTPAGDAGQQADSAQLGAFGAGLPAGWEKEYAAALRRAQKAASLPKLATQFWDTMPLSWPQVSESEHGPTAAAIYDAFQNNFGNKAKIDAALEKLGALP